MQTSSSHQEHSKMKSMQQEAQKPVLVIGGTSSGVGKTSISVGLMAALRYGIVYIGQWQRGSLIFQITLQRIFKLLIDFANHCLQRSRTYCSSIQSWTWYVFLLRIVDALFCFSHVFIANELIIIFTYPDNKPKYTLKYRLHRSSTSWKCHW